MAKMKLEQAYPDIKFRWRSRNWWARLTRVPPECEHLEHGARRTARIEDIASAATLCVNRLWHVPKLTRRYVLVKRKAPCKIAHIMGNPDVPTTP